MAFPSRVDFRWRPVPGSPGVQSDSAALARKLATNPTAEALQQAIDTSKKLKPPPGYDAHYGEMRQLYEGNQLEAMIEDLQRRFKNSASKMDPTPLNVVQHRAHLAAQVYRQPAERWVEVGGERPGDVAGYDDDGEPLIAAAADIPRQAAFAKGVRDSRVHAVMQEAEKRVRGVHTKFIVCRWDDSGAEMGIAPRPRLDLWYPHNVQALPHPDLPGELWASWTVALRIARPGGGSGEWYRVFSRAEEMGEWFISEVSTEGGRLGNPRPYGSNHLPIVAYHDGHTDGLFCDRDRYVRNIQHAINALLTDWAYGAKMQAHGERWISGKDADRMKGAKLAVGPGKMHTFPENTTAGVFQFGFDLTTLQGAEQLLKAVGFTSRQPADAWSTKPGNPPTGVSREIANAPSAERREEDESTAKAFEETALLPMLARVIDDFGDYDAAIGGEGVSFHVRFPPPKRFVEPRAQADLAALYEQRGWLSPAAAAVRGGAYRSIDDAVSAGLSDRLKPPAPPPQFGRPDESAEDSAPEDDAEQQETDDAPDA